MKVSERDSARICRGLSLLLHAGVSLSEGVFLLAEENQGDFQDLMQKLGEYMDQGMSLSEAMQESEAFSNHMVGMLRVGEEAGRMEETLESLASFYEERERMSRQIRNALTYPCMLLLLMLVVIAVLLIKVLPVFDEVYAALGSRLTGLSAGLLHLGNLLESILPALLILLAAAAVGVLVLCACPPVRDWGAAWWQRCFGDKGVLKKFNNAHFTRALSIGFSSGLSLEEAVELSQKLLANIPGAAGRCSRCAEALKNGGAIPEAMQGAGFLSPSQSRMLMVGIRGGSADQMMENIADKLMEDAVESLESIMMKIEPTMVMITSLLVGAILLSVMLPLMNIMMIIG